MIRLHKYLHTDLGVRWCILFATISGLVLPVRSPANAFQDHQLVRFVRGSLPYNLGTVRDKTGEVVQVQLPRGVKPRIPLRVRVLRLTVDEDGSQNVKQVATGSLVPVSSEKARLKVPPSRRGRIRAGDLVRVKPVELYIRDQTGDASRSLVRRLRSLRQVRRVRAGKSLTDDVPQRAVVLSIGSRQAVLKQGSRREIIARLGSPNQGLRTVQPGPSKKKPSYVKRIEVDRFVRDFEWLSWPGRPSQKILCMTTASQFGCGRWSDGELRSVRWHSTSYGYTLDMSLLPSLIQGGNLPFVIVSRRGNTVYSTYYEYDLYRRRLTRGWSESNVWMAKRGRRVIGQIVRGSSLFSDPPVPMSVTTEGWEHAPASSGSPPSPPNDSLVFSMAQKGPLTFYLSREGTFQVYRGNEKVTSFEGRKLLGFALGDFGGSPFEISPPQSLPATKQILHPAPLVLQNAEASEYRIYLVRNKKGGAGGFFGMQSYNDAKVFSFNLDSRNLTKQWSSGSLTGLITDLESDGTSCWFNLVKPDRERTVFYRIHSPQLRSSR